jgi:hypothetical protein
LQLPPLAPDWRTGARPCVSPHALQDTRARGSPPAEECPRPLPLLFTIPTPLFNRPATMHEPTQPPLCGTSRPRTLRRQGSARSCSRSAPVSFCSRVCRWFAGRARGEGGRSLLLPPGAALQLSCPVLKYSRGDTSPLPGLLALPPLTVPASHVPSWAARLSRAGTAARSPSRGASWLLREPVHPAGRRRSALLWSARWRLIKTEQTKLWCCRELVGGIQGKARQFYFSHLSSPSAW